MHNSSHRHTNQVGKFLLTSLPLGFMMQPAGHFLTEKVKGIFSSSTQQREQDPSSFDPIWLYAKLADYPRAMKSPSTCLNGPINLPKIVEKITASSQPQCSQLANSHPSLNMKMIRSRSCARKYESKSIRTALLICTTLCVWHTHTLTCKHIHM